MSDALREAAELGGFFALDLEPSGPAWLPFPGDVEGRLRAGADRRAAASTDFLALMARCVSPLLAAAVHAQMVPELTVAVLAVHRESGALGVTATVGERTAAALGDVVESLAEAAVTRYAADFHLSRQVLWGNVASALAGAATVLGGDAAEAAVRAALDTGRLAGTGAYEAPRRFRRRSCCLIYRLPGGGLCGDCVLAGA